MCMEQEVGVCKLCFTGQEVRVCLLCMGQGIGVCLLCAQDRK